jgi:transposase-like protein
MGKPNFSDEFKRDAVAQITERGYPVAEVSQRLGVSQHSLYAWKRQLAKVVSGDASKDAEIRQLKRELARVTEERDILKTYGPPRRQGVNSRWHDGSASTYPVSRLKPWPRWISAQSGPHKSAGAEHHI